MAEQSLSLYLSFSLSLSSLYDFTFCSFAAARHVSKRSLGLFSEWIQSGFNLRVFLGNMETDKTEEKKLVASQQSPVWAMDTFPHFSEFHPAVSGQQCDNAIVCHAAGLDISSPYVSPRDLSNTSCFGHVR